MSSSCIISGIVGAEPNVMRFEAGSSIDPFGGTGRSWVTSAA
jgi:hypothetical protein